MAVRNITNEDGVSKIPIEEPVVDNFQKNIDFLEGIVKELENNLGIVAPSDDSSIIEKEIYNLAEIAKDTLFDILLSESTYENLLNFKGKVDNSKDIADIILSDKSGSDKLFDGLTWIKDQMAGKLFGDLFKAIFIVKGTTEVTTGGISIAAGAAAVAGEATVVEGAAATAGGAAEVATGGALVGLLPKILLFLSAAGIGYLGYQGYKAWEQAPDFSVDLIEGAISDDSGKGYQDDSDVVYDRFMDFMFNSRDKFNNRIQDIFSDFLGFFDTDFNVEKDKKNRNNKLQEDINRIEEDNDKSFKEYWENKKLQKQSFFKSNNDDTGIGISGPEYIESAIDRDLQATTIPNIQLPNISISFGDVYETADVDQIIKRIGTILRTQIATASEGVYA